jgi:hypothetical protein
MCDAIKFIKEPLWFVLEAQTQEIDEIANGPIGDMLPIFRRVRVGYQDIAINDALESSPPFLPSHRHPNARFLLWHIIVYSPPHPIHHHPKIAQSHDSPHNHPASPPPLGCEQCCDAD